MNKKESSAVEVESSPNLSTSSPKRKKKKKNYRRNDTEERESEESQSVVYSQDIIKSSQPTVSTKHKKQSANCNSEKNIVWQQISEPVECEIFGEPQSVEFSRNAPESHVESGETSSRDHVSKVRRKKAKKKTRISFTADSESDSDQDCHVVENENQDYLNYAESNQTNLDEKSKKTRLKVKRKRSGDTTLIDNFSPARKKHADYQRTLNDNFELEGVTKTEKLSPEVSIQGARTETKGFKKDKKLRTKKNVEKRRYNSLSTLINDSTSHSDLDEDHKRVSESSEKTRKKEKLRKHKKRRVSDSLSVTKNEENNRNLNANCITNAQFKAALSNRDKTSDDHRSDSEKNYTRCPEDDQTSLKLKEKIKSEELSDTASRCGSPNISVKDIKTEPELLEESTSNEERIKVETNRPNTLLNILHDGTSSSDSEDETKKLGNSSRKSAKNESRVSETLVTSDEEVKNDSSDKKYAESFIASPESDHTPNHQSGSDEDDRKESIDTLQSFSQQKKLKSEELLASGILSDSPPKISASNVTELEGLINNRRHSAKNISKNLLAIIHNSTSSSDFDDESKKSDDSSTEFLDKKNLMKSRKTKKPSDKDIKVEPKVERAEQKHQVIKKVKKKGSSTLLRVIQDDSRSSDSDDEKMKIHDSETAEEVSVEKPVRKLSGDRRFDLEAEAKDVEQMIIALREEEHVPSDTVRVSLIGLYRKLHKLRIKFRHTVPPQHQVETVAGSRAPTKKQITKMEKFGPIKRGVFTPEEDTIIVNNWKAFCKMHDWDVRNVQPFLYMRHLHVGFVAKFSERIKFVQFLADGLPWRTLYSVYWRFRNLYQPHLQTRYTQDEDNMIIAYMENSTAINEKNVRKFSELAKVLNRTRASVWRRYRLLKKNRNPHEKTEWDSDTVKKVIKGLMKLTLTKDVSQLKDLDIPRVVWGKLSMELNIDKNDLKQFWLTRLHMQLFCKEPVYLNDVKIKIIEFLYSTGVSDWSELEWSNVAKHFDGMTSIFLSQTFNLLIHDENLKGKEFPEMMEYLYEVRKPQLQKNSKDKSLPRIVFKHGTVKVIDKCEYQPKQENMNEDFSD